MSKRSWWSLVVAAALVLAGLGHYFLLFQRIYIWDAVLFYALAASLLIWASLRAEEIPERSWARVRFALRRLGVAFQRIFLQQAQDGFPSRLNRLQLISLTTLNVLAAFAAFRIPHPRGMLLVLLLWASSILVLAVLVIRPRRKAESSVSTESAQGTTSADTLVGIPLPVSENLARRDLAVHSSPLAVPIALGGWILLVAALLVLRMDQAPALLAGLGGWLAPRLQSLHLDLPMPPGVWVPGSLLALIGLSLIGWAGCQGGLGLLLRWPGGGDGITNTRPFVVQTATSAKAKRLVGPRRVLVLVAAALWAGVVYSSALGSTDWFVLPLWLIALGVSLMYWWQVDHARGVSVLSTSFKRSTWLVGPALILAFGVGLYRLTNVPNSIWGDEGAFWTLARDLAQGARVNPFGLGVYNAFPVTSSLYQGLFIRLFGPTLWSWRLSSVVIGTGSLLPLFFLTRKLLGERVAWSATALMVAMPYFLAYERMGYNNIQTLLPVTLGLWFLVEAVSHRSCLLSCLAGIAFGIASLSYMAGHIGLVLAGLAWVFLYVKRKPLRGLLLKLVPSAMMGWFFAAGPFILGSMLGGQPFGAKVAESFFGSAFYGQAVFSLEEITRSHPLRQLGQHQAFFEPRIYALLVARGLIRTGVSFLRDEVARYHYLVGPLAGPLPVFFLAGFGWMLGQWRRFSATIWTMWILACATLLSALNTFPPRAAHMVPIIPALAVVTAVGIWLLVDLIQHLLEGVNVRWVGFALVTIIFISGLRNYFIVMPQRYVPNLENVMFWRAREMEGGSNLVFVIDELYSLDFSVWGIDEFPLKVDYHNLPADEVHTTDFRVLCGASCRVFFLPSNADAVKQQLHAELGEGTVEAHVDAVGRTIGLEFVPD